MTVIRTSAYCELVQICVDVKQNHHDQQQMRKDAAESEKDCTGDCIALLEVYVVAAPMTLCDPSSCR